MSAVSSRWVMGALVASAMAGCGGGGGASGGEGAAASQEQAVQVTAEQARQLAELRRAVAPFHDFDAAQQAGWSAQITGCMENPPLGAMGYHYGNPALIDGTVDLLQPELLLYEPRPAGQLRFVGVEYIVPYTALPADSQPPVLLGQEFHRNDTFQLWGLHVWIGRHNPSGLFADWNPEVSCAYASP